MKKAAITFLLLGALTVLAAGCGGMGTGPVRDAAGAAPSEPALEAALHPGGRRRHGSGHLMNRQASGGNLGLQPGPFAVQGARLAWFVGLGQGKHPMQLTRTDDDGATFQMSGLGRIGDPATPDFAPPMAISFVDTRHGWLAGRHGKHGTLMYTTDGHTFRDAP